MSRWTDKDSRDLDDQIRALRRAERSQAKSGRVQPGINTGPPRGDATGDDQRRRNTAARQMRRP